MNISDNNDKKLREEREAHEKRKSIIPIRPFST